MGKFDALLPPLSSDEMNALRADIKANGVLHPVFVDEDGNVLDGRHRLKCDKNAPRKVIKGLTEAEKMAFVIRCNFVRRNLSPEQKTEARERMKQIAADLREEDAKKWTQAKVAAVLGVAQNTVSVWFGDTSNVNDDKASKPDARMSVPVEAKAEIVEQVESGKSQKQVAADAGISQQRVSQIVTQEKAKTENKAKVEAITKKKAKGYGGLYDVLVIDPPWPMQKVDREERPNQSEFDYPTMQESELAGMILPCKADSHVWLWTTHKFLPMAFRLLESWDLKYVCTFVWHKPGGFQPFGLPQYNCEFALYARRGSPKFISTKQFPVCFDAPRGAHSEKPDAFYDIVRRVAAGKRLDMFNRRKLTGFTGWGKEA